MDRHYSTLELVKHDESAKAPERDYDATAFELDTSALAPQVSNPQYVARSCIDYRFRLYLIQRHRCSMMVHCLRLMATRSPPKDTFMSPSVRLNGHGLLWR